jgi:GT2 family glycosyltransferase
MNRTAGRRPTASDVAVIVPVGGGGRGWRRCARALARLDPKPGQLIVAVDGPSEALEAVARETGATVGVLEERGGPARARNRAVESVDTDIIAFVDADVVVPSDFAARVAELFADSDVAAVIGSYDDDPGDPGFFSQYRNLLHHHVHQQGREEASTFWSGCGAVRRAAFLEVGGFDEGFGEPSIEDIELGGRLIAAGHRIRMVKDLQVQHLKRWTFGGMVATDLFRRAIPWTEVMLGRGGLINDLNVKTGDRISVVAAYLIPIFLIGSALWPPLAIAAAAALGAILMLNRGFVALLARRRGPGFAIAAVPVYWIYLVICGLGFAIGLGRRLLRRRRVVGATVRSQ